MGEVPGSIPGSGRSFCTLCRFLLSLFYPPGTLEVSPEPLIIFCCDVAHWKTCSAMQCRCFDSSRAISNACSHLLILQLMTGEREIALNPYPTSSRPAKSFMSSKSKGKRRERDVPEDEVALIDDNAEEHDRGGPSSARASKRPGTVAEN